MLAMTLIVFMSVPMASSLQRNLLIWKLSHIEASRLFSIMWRRRIEEHVQSLALNSILAFSCYLPASHIFFHKLCVSYRTITFSIFAFITILRDYNDLMWLSKVHHFKQNQPLCSPGHLHVRPTPEIEFPQSLVFFLCSCASCSVKSHGDL